MRTAPCSQVAVPVSRGSQGRIASPARRAHPIGGPVAQLVPTERDDLYCYASATAAPVDWDAIRRHRRGPGAR